MCLARSENRETARSAGWVLEFCTILKSIRHVLACCRSFLAFASCVRFLCSLLVCTSFVLSCTSFTSCQLVSSAAGGISRSPKSERCSFAGFAALCGSDLTLCTLPHTAPAIDQQIEFVCHLAIPLYKFPFILHRFSESRCRKTAPVLMVARGFWLRDAANPKQQT